MQSRVQYRSSEVQDKMNHRSYKHHLRPRKKCWRREKLCNRFAHFTEYRHWLDAFNVAKTAKRAWSGEFLCGGWKLSCMRAAFNISATGEMKQDFRLTTIRRRISATLTAAESNLSAVVHYKPLSEDIAWFRTSSDSVNRNNKRQLIIGILTIDEKQLSVQIRDR